MNKLEKSAFLLIRRNLAGTRAELARELGVSRPTASTLTEHLLEQGLIRECGKGKSTGGTSPILLTVTKNSAYYAGLDIGYGDRMAAVLIDNSGTIVSHAETELVSSDLRDLSEKAVSLLRRISGRKKVSGAAVAISGIVDRDASTVLKSVNPFYCGTGITELLERVLEMPVTIWNRSRAAAVSEAFGGAADRERDFALISLGVSVGSAFWSNGKIFDGCHSTAGEIRNLRLNCGLRFEDALSLTRIRDCGINGILALCADGLEQVLSVMDMELLVLAGRFADFGGDFPEKLEEILKKEHPVRVRSAKFGRLSAARGAAFRMGEIML